MFESNFGSVRAGRLNTLILDKLVGFPGSALLSSPLCGPRFLRNESFKAQSDFKLKRANSEGLKLSHPVMFQRYHSLWRDVVLLEPR